MTFKSAELDEVLTSLRLVSILWMFTNRLH